MRNITRTMAATMLAASVVLVGTPAHTAHAASTSAEVDCSDYITRLDVLATSWERQTSELEAWKGRTVALTTNLAASEAQRVALETALASSESRVDRLTAKVQALRAKLRQARSN